MRPEVCTLERDSNVAALQDYTIKLYREIERESGVSCGIHQTGCLYLAVSDKEVEFFQAERTKARYLDLALDFIDLAEVRRLNPLIETSTIGQPCSILTTAMWIPVA